MNTKEVCVRLSVTPKMLRVYENQGLLKVSRASNNYREYGIGDILKVKVIVVLRDLGFSLNEIHSLLNMREFQNDMLLDNFYIQLKAVEIKIKELNKVRINLKDSINHMLSKDMQKEDLYNSILECCLETSGQNHRLENFIEKYNFDEMAYQYIDRFLKNDSEYQKAIISMQRLIKTFPPGTHILDVGCGSGELWKQMGDGFNLQLMDNSLKMLLVAKKTIPWATCVFEDILELSEESSGCYDFVVSTFMLHHISYDRQAIAIRKMLSLCKDTGTVIIVDRSFSNDGERAKAEQEFIREGRADYVETIGNEFFLDAKQVMEITNTLGFLLTYKKLSREVGQYVIHGKNA